MTKPERAKYLLSVYEQAEQDSYKVYWTKAKCLSLFKREELWKLLFDGAGTWGEFCNHIRIPVSSAQQKIVVWEFFIDKLKFAVSELMNKDTSCLYALAKAAASKTANKEQMKPFLELIDKLSRQEFLDSIKGKCSHEHTKEKKTVIEVCTDCNKKVKDIS